MSAPDRPTATDARRFCRTLLLFIAILAMLAAAFDAVVDPYMVWGAPRIAHFNAIKPASQDRPAMVKSYLFRRMKPQTLILGSSKAQVGIDPQTRLLPEDAGRVFNLGLAGIWTSDLFDVTRVTTESAPIHRILLLVDLIDFMQPSRPSADGSSALPFLPDWRRRLTERAEALLSLDALKDSVATVLGQNGRYPSGFTVAGRMLEGDFQRTADRDGAAMMFDQKRSYMLYKIVLTTERLAAMSDRRQVDTTAISQILALCRQRHIEIDIAISPVHAEELRAVALAGLWPRYEAAKRALTGIVAAEGGGQVALWDFMGFDPISTETVPASGDRAGRTVWFWEPNHFRPALGEKMLTTIYHLGTDFGRRLTPDMIDRSLAREATSLQADEAAYSADYAQLRAAMKSP